MSDDVEGPRWPAAWTRAALSTAILTTVERGPLHGYGIAGALAQRGFGRPMGGSLYPLLATLEGDGAVEAAWEQADSGPGRRTYTLTDAGRRRLADERHAWKELAAALSTRADDGRGEHDGDA